MDIVVGRFDSRRRRDAKKKIEKKAKRAGFRDFLSGKRGKGKDGPKREGAIRTDTDVALRWFSLPVSVSVSMAAFRTDVADRAPSPSGAWA
eukprot:scaffold584_cov338-Pavlova_lutheri.AAC.9